MAGKNGGASMIAWEQQTFTVQLNRVVPYGRTEGYTQEVTGMVAVGTGLGYWESHKDIAGDEVFNTRLITHIPSGLRIAADPNTDSEVQRFIEAMCQPFPWNGETITIDWNMSGEELQALPCWPDIMAIRREQWATEVAA
jgi:hypothetical protein